MSKKTKEEKERHKKTQEDFTPVEVVKKLLPDSLSIKESVIDIACGTGNILIGVIKKKLSLCTSFKDCVSAVESIYGIDFMADNVESCRNRLYDEVCTNYPDEMNDNDNNRLIRRIIKNRIQWYDTLLFDFDNWPPIDESMGEVDFKEENKDNNEDYPMWVK